MSSWSLRRYLRELTPARDELLVLAQVLERTYTGTWWAPGPSAGTWETFNRHVMCSWSSCAGTWETLHRHVELLVLLRRYLRDLTQARGAPGPLAQVLERPYTGTWSSWSSCAGTWGASYPYAVCWGPSGRFGLAFSLLVVVSSRGIVFVQVLAMGVRHAISGERVWEGRTDTRRRCRTFA
jgi:hypothetical protein